MTTINDILQFMEQIAPQNMKMEWDNVGLLVGSKNDPVSKILVALDPFEHVCNEAVDFGAQLLITHHPLIFHGMKSVTDETSVGRGVRILIRNGINAINAHTNYDCAPGGVNDVFAELLGLENVTVIQSMDAPLLRAGDVPEQTLEQFLATVKEKLHCKGLRYVDAGKPVRKVAVGGGACSGGSEDALRAGCDTFVTSDVGYNRFWDAHDMGLNMIDAGHFQTENPSMLVLAEKIAAQFPEIEVKISETHVDCMKFY